MNNMKCYTLLIAIAFVSMLNGCKSDKEKDQDPNTGEDISEHAEISKSVEGEEVDSDQFTVVYAEGKEALKAYYELPHIKTYYDWNEKYYTSSYQWKEKESSKPLAIDYDQDLSALPYDELRLLRNEVFALNGYLFKDGFLRGYFNRFQWYMPIFDVDTFKVTLNAKEQALIKAIIQEEAKRKAHKTIDKQGLELFNADLVANTKQFAGSIPTALAEDLANQNFSIVDANRSMPFYAYDRNAYQYIPHYITTDLFLFILHKYFSKFLEDLDEFHLSVKLRHMLVDLYRNLEGLSSNTHQSSIDWAKTYTAIALNTLGSKSEVPASFQEKFQQELSYIKKEQGNPVFISNSAVNYQELKPRGHYTKTDTLQQYFKCFKWLSLNGVDISKDKQLKGLISLGFVLKNNPSLLSTYKEYNATIEKLAGPVDNIAITDFLDVINGNTIDENLRQSQLKKVRNHLSNLQKERVKKRFGESFDLDEKETKRVYFLSSTYSVSGEIFSKLIHIDGLNSKRAFPRALDVAAVFGNETAERIITEVYRDQQKWPAYTTELEKLQQQFAEMEDWNQNYGFKGLQTALAATAETNAYPDYMKTDAYNRKELSTMLSSWTHIKHDLILYQEKPYGAEAGEGGGPPPPDHYSYVEPNMVFWESSVELINWLEEHFTPSQSLKYDLQKIKGIGIMLRDVARKQQNDEVISRNTYNELHHIGGQIEHILISLFYGDHIPEREKSMALIADVYVYNGLNLNVAVGHADDIYVVVPINGEYYIARGSVFSFYEFKGKIYNDQEWRKRVQKGNLPERPAWIQPIIQNVKPLEGQMQIR